MSRTDFIVPHTFKIMFVWASIAVTLGLVVYQYEKRSNYWERHITNTMQPVASSVVPSMGNELESLYASVPSLEGPVLYHFWATWCAPCRTEIPTLNALQRKFEGRLKVVTISADENKDDVLRFFAKSAPQFAVLWDKSQKMPEKWGVHKYPESFLVQKNGKVLRFMGARDWSSREAADFLNAVL